MTTLDAAVWRKASYSSNAGNCVEIAVADDHVGVRDTKNRVAGHLVLNRASFAAFLSAMK
ncbi:DUF397 domain-containing protein [Tamaricihabitans halophyticus]|nr:DUF397 domain-containing protein [Tamaricihabitans halophyticus]